MTCFQVPPQRLCTSPTTGVSPGSGLHEHNALLRGASPSSPSSWTAAGGARDQPPGGRASSSDHAPLSPSAASASAPPPRLPALKLANVGFETMVMCKQKHDGLQHLMPAAGRNLPVGGAHGYRGGPLWPTALFRRRRRLSRAGPTAATMRRGTPRQARSQMCWRYSRGGLVF